ncbi:MAG: Ig-like domain-containing protein [bacterium]|nr:Ig-like domain-containing protein [bacterium]
MRDTTNALGRVNLIFRTFAQVGDQIIAATAGGVTAQRILVIRQGRNNPNIINLTATPTLLEADINGFAQTRIDFTIRDQGNQGIPNFNGLFSATGGSIIFPLPTDSNGHTSFFWNFTNEFGEFWLTARAGTKRDSVMVHVQESPDLFSLTVTADPSLLEIDSNEEVHSQVTITLLDGFGQGRPNALVNISASGGIIPELPLTDANGQIQFNWAFRGFGDYYLFAYYSEWGLRDTVTVLISLRVHEPPQVSVYTIPLTLRVDSNTVGTAFIRVVAQDENGILLPGITPTLSVEAGEFDPPPPTDSNGESETEWRFFNQFDRFQVTAMIEYNGQAATDNTLINVVYGP